jgi:predicted GH43/DUF377 family glycosyl hydrolase
MPPFRYPENPLLTPHSLTPVGDGHEIIGVFNAGVARVGPETVLLLRVAERPRTQQADCIAAWYYDASQDAMRLQSFEREDPALDLADPRLIVTTETIFLTSLSYLRVARSRDARNFTADEDVLLWPERDYEAFGLEDPRITRIGDTYHIQYVGVSAQGICTCLATTKDFRSVARQGIVFGPENKDVVFFPDPIGGRHYALHRPASPFSLKNEMWLAESPDLMCWGHHRHLAGLRPHRWDSHRIGAGAPPLRTDRGWLEIYHGADADNRYCLGAMLLDTHEPWKVLARSARPILEPEADYECNGFFGQVVFTCGALLEGQTLRLYYGAADTCMACAEIPLADIWAALAYS